MFKARPIPATHDKPDIVPRTTRAAALRAGQAVDKAPRGLVSKERLAQMFTNVPGHKRINTITVASSTAPSKGRTWRTYVKISHIYNKLRYIMLRYGTMENNS